MKWMAARAAAVEVQSNHIPEFALDANIRCGAELWLGRRGSDTELVAICDAFAALEGKHQPLPALDLGGATGDLITLRTKRELGRGCRTHP
jgi:hypothetical protein